MKDLITSERIERAILLIRGHKVMLDAELAVLYGVSVGRLNEAVKRNRDRFPDDFMFQLSAAEFHNLKLQIGDQNLKSQIAISSSDWGGRRHPPYALRNRA
jgi:ORF6N domain-containing protein